MRFLPVVLAFLLFPLALAQSRSTSLVDFKVYTDHPRLFLDGGRIQRLRKDFERGSDRWMALRQLHERNAEFPEEPLLRALEYQVAADESSGRKAIEWAVATAATGQFSDPAPLRMGAVVFDWCYPRLSPEERSQIAAALARGVRAVVANENASLGAVRSALLAAIAVSGDSEDSLAMIEELLGQRWERQILPALQRGEALTRAFHLVALLEITHAVRRNLDRDLWNEAPNVFRPLPLVQMLSYYPEPLRTPTGLMRQPAAPTTAEFDVQVEATLSRIAEMMLVAYENTLENFQLLQGWLRHDSFTLTDPFGAVYEFLWVNPYLPGLSYFSAPPVVYDAIRGRVFARSGWQDEDLWVGFLDGQLQIFADGERMVIERDTKQAPLAFPGAALVPGRVPMKFVVRIPAIEHSAVNYTPAIYVVGLGEGQTYSVRINESAFTVLKAGRGGVLVLESQPEQGVSIDFGKPVEVRIKPAPRGGPSLRKKP